MWSCELQKWQQQQQQQQLGSLYPPFFISLLPSLSFTLKLPFSSSFILSTFILDLLVHFSLALETKEWVANGYDETKDNQYTHTQSAIRLWTQWQKWQENSRTAHTHLCLAFFVSDCHFMYTYIYICVCACVRYMRVCLPSTRSNESRVIVKWVDLNNTGQLEHITAAALYIPAIFTSRTESDIWIE